MTKIEIKRNRIPMEKVSLGDVLIIKRMFKKDMEEVVIKKTPLPDGTPFILRTAIIGEEELTGIYRDKYNSKKKIFEYNRTDGPYKKNMVGYELLKKELSSVGLII